MEYGIRLNVLFQIIFPVEAGEIIPDLQKLFFLFLTDPAVQGTDRVAFQHGPHFKDLGDFLRCKCPDKHALVRDLPDKAVCGEKAKRLTHRAAADFQFRRKLLFLEPVIGFIYTGDNLFSENLIDLMAHGHYRFPLHCHDCYLRRI